jgi:hypothetical protein
MFCEVWLMYRRLHTEGLSSCGGATLTVRQDEGTTRLPLGYRRLDGDPLEVVLRHENGTVVARFTHIDVDPEEIRRAAEEERRGTPEARQKDPYTYIHPTS